MQSHFLSKGKTSPPALESINTSSGNSATSSGFSTPRQLADDDDDDTADKEIKRLFKNVTPPKISAKKCVKLAEYYGISWNNQTDHGKKVLAFLFERKVPKMCVDQLGKDSTGNLAEDHKKVGQLLLKAANLDFAEGQRAEVIVWERGQIFSENIPSDVLTYEEFEKSLNENHPWCSVKALRQDYVNLLEDDPETKRDALDGFSWVQVNATCYMHAPAAVYRYICCWHGIDHDRSLLDIPRYMRHFFTTKQIWEHVFGKEGGHSYKVLERLLGNRHDPFPMGRADDAELFPTRIARNLRKYGPLLMSNALLPMNFGDNIDAPGRGSETNFPPSTTKERHAMVLLGVGKDENGESWYLLQNWHRHQQFLVVDFDWLFKSEAHFFMLCAEKGDFQPPELDVHVFHEEQVLAYAEASPGVDRSEGHYDPEL